MARDIEEFLRKAAERRKQQQQGQTRPPQTPPKSAQHSRPPVPPKPPRPKAPPILDSSQVEVVDIGRESVRDHVKRHINTRDIVDHVKHLGQEVGLADEKIEAHLHEKFGQGMGTLKMGLDPYASQDRTPGRFGPNELIAILQNKKSVRQAIIVSELFKRPDFDF